MSKNAASDFSQAVDSITSLRSIRPLRQMGHKKGSLPLISRSSSRLDRAKAQPTHNGFRSSLSRSAPKYAVISIQRCLLLVLLQRGAALLRFLPSDRPFDCSSLRSLRSGTSRPRCRVATAPAASLPSVGIPLRGTAPARVALPATVLKQ